MVLVDLHFDRKEERIASILSYEQITPFAEEEYRIRRDSFDREFDRRMAEAKDPEMREAILNARRKGIWALWRHVVNDVFNESGNGSIWNNEFIPMIEIVDGLITTELSMVLAKSG